MDASYIYDDLIAKWAETSGEDEVRGPSPATRKPARKRSRTGKARAGDRRPPRTSGAPRKRG